MQKERFITRPGICGLHLISRTFIGKDELIFDFSTAQKLNSPTYQTIQINACQHIIPDSPFLYLNHSCRPNAFVDSVSLAIYALVDIAAQQELTFFYPATEWQMAESFICRCNHENCLTSISGAAALSKKQLQDYKMNPHILAMTKI